MSIANIMKLPKIDLHCHLDGSLSLQTVKELLNQDIQLESLQVAEDCRSLPEYLEKFNLPLQCLQSAKGLELAAYRFIEEVAKEHVVYVEVRFAPMLSVHEHLSCKQVIEAVLLGIEKGKQEFGVSGNVIVCAMRHHSEEQNLAMIKTAREFFGHGVCALDLAGNEVAFPMKEFRTIFQQAKRWDLPFTIHAGECGSVENIKEAIDCGATRIGHGIALHGHSDVQEFCKNKQIGIEMCPTSNMQTKAVEHIQDYPLEEFLKNGLCVTINTDNRTVSNTSIMKEIEFVKKHCHQTDEDIVKLMKNAVEVSFTTEVEKQRLLNMF